MNTPFPHRVTTAFNLRKRLTVLRAFQAVRSRLTLLVCMTLVTATVSAIPFPANSFAAQQPEQEKHGEAPLTLLPQPGQQPQQQSGTGITLPSVNTPTPLSQGNLQLAPSGQLPGSSPGELRDIHGPVMISSPSLYLLPILGGVLALLVAGCLLLWWFRRKKSGPPPVPPWDRALSELDSARSLRTPAQGLAYMDRVSAILRSYLEERFGEQFGLRSTRQTTSEFLGELLRSGEESPLHLFNQQLQHCLECADMAKFAHHLPESGLLKDVEQSVREVIIGTSPLDLHTHAANSAPLSQQPRQPGFTSPEQSPAQSHKGSSQCSGGAA